MRNNMTDEQMHEIESKLNALEGKFKEEQKEYDDKQMKIKEMQI